MTMITPSYLGETIEYSSLHACRSTLEDPTRKQPRNTIVRSCGFDMVAAYDRMGEDAWLEGQHHLGFVHRQTGLPFELHWRVGPRFRQDSLPAELLFTDAPEVLMLGRAVKAPSPASAALVHAVHSAAHLWDAVERLAAMAALLEGLTRSDQDRVARRARAAACLRRLHVAVLLAHHLGGASVSAHLLQAASADGIAVDLASRVGARLLCLPAGPSGFRGPKVHERAAAVLWEARSLDGRGATVRHLWRKLTVPAVTDFPTGQDPTARRPGRLRTLTRRQRRFWTGAPPAA